MTGYPTILDRDTIAQNAKPGQIVLINALGHPYNVVNTMTSWISKAYRKNANNTFTMVN